MKWDKCSNAERAAVAAARELSYLASGQDFAVSAKMFDLVESAFQHVEAWDEEEGEYVRVNVLFNRPNESRRHLIFKGVAMFRGE